MRKFLLGFVTGVIVFAGLGYALCEYGECCGFEDFRDKLLHWGE